MGPPAAETPVEAKLQAVASDTSSAPANEPGPLGPLPGQQLELSVPDANTLGNSGNARRAMDSTVPPGQPRQESRLSDAIPESLSLNHAESLDSAIPGLAISSGSGQPSLNPVTPRRRVAIEHRGSPGRPDRGVSSAVTSVILLTRLGIVMGFLALKDGLWAEWQRRSLEIAICGVRWRIPILKPGLMNGSTDSRREPQVWQVSLQAQSGGRRMCLQPPDNRFPIQLNSIFLLKSMIVTPVTMYHPNPKLHYSA